PWPTSRSALMCAAGSESRVLPSRHSRTWNAGSRSFRHGPVSCGISRRRFRDDSGSVDAVYRTNLTPNEWPRRQTTLHLRPVLASREKASRTRPESTLESGTVIFAPVNDMSCTKHGRVAKPPSSVTHADCCTDLRTSRFLAAGTIWLFRFE